VAGASLANVGDAIAASRCWTQLRTRALANCRPSLSNATWCTRVG
jgi:hypothetical protein